MSARRSTKRATTHTTDALLLGRISYGESDLIVTLFTSDFGKLSALARGARKSQKRFGGGLEPFHTLRVVVEEREGQQLSRLAEARLENVRPGLVTSLSRMEAASRALSWVRKGATERTPEPALWRDLILVLDALEADDDDLAAERRVAGFGLRLLGTFGWGLELEQCVRCGRACTPSRAATIDPVRGGIVCRACGGGPILVRGAERARFLSAAQGDRDALEARDADRVLGLVDDALRAHTGAK